MQPESGVTAKINRLNTNFFKDRLDSMHTHDSEIDQLTADQISVTQTQSGYFRLGSIRQSAIGAKRADKDNLIPIL